MFTVGVDKTSYRRNTEQMLICNSLNKSGVGEKDLLLSEDMIKANHQAYLEWKDVSYFVPHKT